jgi:hypothetical protein
MAVVDPFPVGRPIRPEARQIGRGPAIDALSGQVIDRRQHTLLFAERRVGKTSMAWAVLDRVRAADHGWAIEANLSRGPIVSSAGLAAHLAEQARAAQVRVDSDAERLREGVGEAAKYGKVVGKVAELLGLGPDLTELATAAETIDQALSGDEDAEPDLRTVLRAIQAAAVAADNYVVVFIDEAQRIITQWSGDEDSVYTQEALAEIMEDELGGIVLLLAGSDREGFEKLMANGQPLHHDGMTFDVLPIADVDWHHHLPQRFAEVELEIEHDRISQILEASGGHPQRTMRVCAHVRQLADGNVYEITDVLVDRAIETARKHRSWSD